MEFLMEMMDLNEELEDLSTTDDLDKFQSQNNTRRDELSAKLSEAFNSGDTDLALELLAQLKYFESMNQRLLDKY